MLLNEDFYGYKVYGPYVNKEPRRVVVIYRSHAERSSMSYARYLVSMQLKRQLLEHEEVDHIDNDKMNDNLENLQVLSSDEHRDKTDGLKSRRVLTLTCPECQGEFTRERRLIVYSQRKYPPACSRSCAGKYQRKQETL